MSPTAPLRPAAAASDGAAPAALARPILGPAARGPTGLLTVCVWLTTEKASESWMRRGRSAARVTSMGATLKRKRRLLCAEETVVMRSRRLAPPSLHVTSVLPVSAASCTPGAISERSSYTSTTCRTMSRG